METRKATLNVNLTAYPVLVVDTVTTLRERVEIDWERVPEFFGATAPEQVFNYFISDIGHDRDDWSYTEDAHCTYYVEPEWVTLDDPVEVSAPPVRDSKHDHWKLTGVASRKPEEFSSEGYSIVRVEHSQDMHEGTITLHYKKEEV